MRRVALSAVAGVVSGMDLVSNLVTGFSVALTPANLGFALLGCLIGMLIGVLPGIGPIATIAVLLPLTFHLVPVSGLIMLTGDPMIFLARPISAGLVAAAAVLLVIVALPAMRSKREAVFQES